MNNLHKPIRMDNTILKSLGVSNEEILIANGCVNIEEMPWFDDYCKRMEREDER